MPLTGRDLDDIRRIVREELARALAPAAPTTTTTTSGKDEDEVSDAESVRLRQMAIARLRQNSAERAARPIPLGPFVDRYDAARLLGVTESTVTSYISSGRLTRNLVKGRIQVNRAEFDELLAARPERRRSRRD